MSGSIKKLYMASVIMSLFLLTACAPEVGSEPWCANLKEKPKGDWTANEVSDYAKHCLFR